MLKEIDINGQKISYTDSGNPDGVPILMMHGWGCNHTTLASIESILASKMRVLNVDLPGFGTSAEPADIWGVEEYTRCMESLLDKLAIEKPVLLGHSFGGRISILMASRRDIRKVILTDAAGVKPRRSVKYYIKIYFYKFIRRILPLLVGKKNGEKLLDIYRGRAGSSDYSSATPRMRAILSKCVNEDLCGVMPGITAPTLLIWGESDTATPISDARKMNSLIPDSGIVSFPGCGHYSFLDNPIGYRTVITEFLKDELK